MNIQYAPPKKTIQYYFIESFMGTSRMKIAKTFTYFSEQHQWKYFQTVFNLIKVKIVIHSRNFCWHIVKFNNNKEYYKYYQFM